VAQVLLRHDDERHWLRAAPRLVGHLFPWLLAQSHCDGTVTGFSLANPKLHGERDQARQTLDRQPANRPAPGTAVVTDKGLSGQGTEEFFAGDSLSLALIRPARKDEKQPRPFPNWLRQRVEAVIWTLKNQLGLGGRIPRRTLGPHHPRVTCPHFPINDPERLRLGPPSFVVPAAFS
jgi:hypothetical protein